MTHTITNIAAYKFIKLTKLTKLREQLLTHCENLELKGTILLGNEGVNLILAGVTANISKFIDYLHSDPRFIDMEFKQSLSAKVPFRRLRLRLKKEIITLKQADIDPTTTLSHYLLAPELKNWLDEEKEFALLDTRNSYEVAIGTFTTAKTLSMSYFSEFPQAIESVDLPKDKPLVMFCTGGIRCEKAAVVMTKAGYNQVYQLQGGILNYFALCGDAHYRGNCFVFDERTAITPEFAETGLTQCPRCSHFLTREEQTHPHYIAWKHCQYCPTEHTQPITSVATIQLND